MHGAAPSGRSGLRTIVIVALSLFVLVSGTADLRRLTHPIGVFGTVADLDGVLTAVAPGSPASNAGIRPGDRFDIAALKPQQRWWLFPHNCAPSAASLTVGVIHNGIEREVTMISVPEPMQATVQAAIVVDVLAGIIFVLIGTFTVLLRPTAVVWAFYLFCLGSAPFPYREFDAALHVPLSCLWIAVILTIGAAGLPGLLIFSVRILQDSVSGWRLWVERGAWLAFAAVAVLYYCYVVRAYLLGLPVEWASAPMERIHIALRLAVVAVLIATYLRALGTDRQRIRWMFVGIGIALVTPYLQLLLSGLDITTPAFYDVIAVVGAVAPIGVAYAILKHRVVNVSFFVSRTIVYGTITAIVVAAFAFIDWLVGKVLDQSRLAIVAEVATAVGIGFWMNALHRQIDRLVDNVLFKSRHVAERALMRFAAGLPHAASFELADDMLADETAAALGLASAAVFRRTSPHRFERMSAVGWGAGTATCLDERDRLVLQLEGERQALRLSEIRWSRADVPAGSAEPALAIPILIRHELGAIVVLGPHKTGEDFDADELRLLSNCAVAAGAAYDHLDADALRRRVDELQHTVESLRTNLQTHGVPSAT